MTVEQEIQLQASYAYDDGFSHGISHGISQGISQGAHDAKVETAKILLANNVEPSIVLKSTGLTAEEIENL